MSEKLPRKVYKVTLRSRGGKVIYVESLNRKRAVEAADLVICEELAEAERRSTPAKARSTELFVQEARTLVCKLRRQGK